MHSYHYSYLSKSASKMAKLELFLTVKKLENFSTSRNIIRIVVIFGRNMLKQRMNSLFTILKSCSLPSIFLSKKSCFKPRLYRVVERLDPIPAKHL